MDLEFVLTNFLKCQFFLNIETPISTKECRLLKLFIFIMAKNDFVDGTRPIFSYIYSGNARQKIQHYPTVANSLFKQTIRQGLDVPITYSKR